MNAEVSYKQAIVTKYRNGKIRAAAEVGAVTVHYNNKLSSEANHAQAALTLAKKWGWDGRWTGSQIPDGRWVWVEVTRVENRSFTLDTK